MKLNQLKSKSVLILGLGREGRDTFLFLRKLFSKKILGIADRLEFKNLKSKIKNYKNIKLHLGKDYLRALKNYDVLIKSPGIPPKTIRPFLKKGQIITSQTEIFFENCPGKIIGVAGTKGKSTTASLIYKILKEGGYRVHLVGNIGQPVLSLLFSATPKDIYVYEISSHQLMNLKKGPAVAILLNIYPDHLDYYKDFKEYAQSEQKIAYYLTKDDYLIFNPSDKLVLEAAKISQAKKIPINPKIVEKFIKIRDIPLAGKFYFLNLAAAIEVGKIFEISAEKIKKAIKEFKPLAHRLELVGEYGRIKFYNASLAVIPETTMAIMESLGEKIQTIFLGGFNRDLNYQELAKKILKSKIKIIILFPPSGQKIWQEIEKEAQKNKVKDLPRHFFIDNMKEGVRIAFQFTEKGKICLLAPASASFGLFRDYRERGNLFKKYVKEYAKKYF